MVFLCLLSTVDRTSYMVLSGGYFTWQCSHFFPGDRSLFGPAYVAFLGFSLLFPSVCPWLYVSEKADFVTLSGNSDDAQKICRRPSPLLSGFTGTWWITWVNQMLLQRGIDLSSAAVPGIVVRLPLCCVCFLLKSAAKVMPTAVLVPLQCRGFGKGEVRVCG